MTGPDSRNTQIAMSARPDPDPDPATRDPRYEQSDMWRGGFFSIFSFAFVNRSFVRSFAREDF